MINTDRFKFRFWYIGYPHHNSIPEMFYNAERAYDDGCRGDNELCYESFASLIDETLEDRGILMQCTGLKDKNGKLIYEGDVLKVKDDDELYYVRWESPSFEACCPTIIEGCPTLYVCNIDWEYSEIIGNLYENSTLINQ
jgi:hypothetical protein